MKKAVGYAALSCALGLAKSKALKWSDEGGPAWHPAQETLAYMPSLGVAGVEAPTPTPPPHPAETRERLEARDTAKNTCGYISGIQCRLDRWASSRDLELTCSPASSLWCAATARCVYNSINHYIGCCDDTTSACPVWTACYDSTDRASFTTANGYTIWW